MSWMMSCLGAAAAFCALLSLVLVFVFGGAALLWRISEVGVIGVIRDLDAIIDAIVSLLTKKRYRGDR